MSERRTFRFGPVERHGFLGPVRPGQALVGLVGTVAGIVLLGSAPSPGRAVGAITIVATAVALGTVPLAGRTVEQWTPVAGAWLLRRLAGAHEFRSQAPVAGVWVGGPLHTASARRFDGPRNLAGVRIAELPYRGRRVGAVSDRKGRLLTSVLACRVDSFALLDPASQEQGLSQWGTILSACADTPVRRVQWLERTVPARSDELARWLADQRDPRVPERGAPIVDSYVELIERGVQVSQDHEVLIAVQVDARRTRAAGPDGLGRTLIEETERIADGLGRLGVRIQGALTATHLAFLFRTAFDPFVRADLAVGHITECQPAMIEEQSAWPIGAAESWDAYRSDGAVHSTYWIAGWPRVEVGAAFLDPLLSHATAVRTVSVTFEPVSTDRSMREVEAQVTRDQADHALRARFGQAETARQEQVYAATRDREAELAAGYGEVRFAGFITVSALDVEQLDVARGDVRRDAARSRLDLRGMYGQQSDAFTFTLPLCRGLR